MIVKTFERPATVRRLIQSARSVFPGRIIVADDSREPLTELGEGVEVIALPFNVGLSAGRNAALDQVGTEYVFVTDDDTVFSPGSDMVTLMDYLDAHPEVDLIAPQLVNLPYWYSVDNQKQSLYAAAAEPLRRVGEDIGGATVVLKVENVFLARTAALQEIRWDEDLRLVEHKDFFSRASGRLVCVQTDAVRAYHVRTPHNDFYMKHRLDVWPYFAIADAKWSKMGGRESNRAEDAQGDDDTMRSSEATAQTGANGPSIEHKEVTMTQAQVIHEGLAFGEAPRWRDGRLWFSDFYRRAVFTLEPDGTETKVVDVPEQPSGLGWLPDGRLLVSSMRDRKVLRLEDDGSLAEHADLGDIAGFHVNDLLTDEQGRAYVGNFGYDLHTDMAAREIPVILGDESAGATSLALIHPEGRVEVAAEGVRFPNGMALIDGGRTLVLAETLRMQLTAFDVADDGSLSNRRVFASTAAQMAAPDGICADPDGGIWVAPALSPNVFRYTDGGELTGVIETSQPVFAVALGGEDGRTLYAMTAPSSDPAIVDGQRLGRIEKAQV